MLDSFLTLRTLNINIFVIKLWEYKEFGVVRVKLLISCVNLSVRCFLKLLIFCVNLSTECFCKLLICCVNGSAG